MRSNIFSYLPEEDREFIEDWVRVQVEKNTQSYSRFDRFLTFVERAATGAKNAVSGTANWVVETISKIGFHILVANVAYFGLTHGVEWYNGKLIETMNENETLTEQIADIRKSSKDTFSKLVAEKDAALKLLEEKQAELDNANKRVKSKQAALDSANKRVESKQVELNVANERVKKKEIELRAVKSPSNSSQGSTVSTRKDKFWECVRTDLKLAYPSKPNWTDMAASCSAKADCKDRTNFTLCWIKNEWGGLARGTVLNKCWDRACQ